ncbi:MAG: hypothetical protein KatS3mg068_0871 [Candidatus Sericytochromatia bacterium]|nr:MAG: hypothetical protein KatS3mg068_0871 [Candidatus Sericytochromatia bacterium]
MNKTIIKIKDNLRKYKDKLIISDETDNCIKIIQKGQKTLPIIFHAKENGFVIYLKGWHRNFLSEDDALDFLAYSLSENIRLKVIKIANIEYKWILEFKNDNNQWEEESFAQIPLFPFWLKSEIEYYQNNLLS